MNNPQVKYPKFDPTIDWCARLQYPNSEPLIAGTLFIEASATLKEVEAAFKKKCSAYIPDGYEILELIRGTVWFAPAKENM